MSKVILEHVNMTVSHPDKTAEMLCHLFDWKIRWQGPSLNNGKTVHVGLDDFYLALYAPERIENTGVDHYLTAGALNHIAVTVDDLDEMEARVKQAGYLTHNHQSYEPGRRFYFNDTDGVEYEVVAY